MDLITFDGACVSFRFFVLAFLNFYELVWSLVFEVQGFGGKGGEDLRFRVSIWCL